MGEEPAGGGRDEQRDGEQVGGEAGCAEEPVGGEAVGRQACEAAGEMEAAPVEEVVAQVGALVGGERRGGCERDDLTGDLGLVEDEPDGKALDGGAVAVAGGLVHAGIDARRVGTEDGLDAAGALDEAAPVLGADEAEAGDEGGDGEAVVGLAVCIFADGLRDAAACSGELLLHPVADEGTDLAQGANGGGELGNEGGGERGREADEVCDGAERGCVGAGRGAEPIGPADGLLAVEVAPALLLHQGADAGEQHHAEERGGGPELGEEERMLTLVTVEEGDEGRFVELAADRLEVALHERMQAEQRGRAAGKAGQAAVEALGKGFEDAVYLLLDEEVVVEEPVCGGRDGAAGGGGGGDECLALGDGAGVGEERLEVVVVGGLDRRAVPHREGAGDLLQALASGGRRGMRRLACEAPVTAGGPA